MVKRLSEHGLLEHIPYRGVQLTEEGRRAALRMVRRHRLIEAYLVEFLAYSWDTVHAEAERLEHAVSEVVEEGVTGFVVDSVDEAVEAVERTKHLSRAAVRERFDESLPISPGVVRHEIEIRRDQRAQVLAKAQIHRRAIVYRTNADRQKLRGKPARPLGEDNG